MNPGFVVLMGLATVFIGLICIIIVCKIMSFFVRLFDKKPAATAPVAPVQNTAPKSAEIPNREEFVAAVSAAIAENLGKDVSGIRILSIKKL